MSAPLVPMCLLHTVPHPCVSCRQEGETFDVRCVADGKPGVPDAEDYSAVESAVSPEALAELAYAGRVLREAQADIAATERMLAESGPLVRFKRFHPRAVCPEYAKPGDAGADLRAVESVRLRPFEPVKVRLGVGVELPPGYEAQLRPRSSLNLEGVYAALGTIDQGYRGEICAVVTLLNRGYSDYVIHIGDKVAQLVIAPVARATFEEAAELGESERGTAGFGSSGR